MINYLGLAKVLLMSRQHPDLPFHPAPHPMLLPAGSATGGWRCHGRSPYHCLKKPSLNRVTCEPVSRVHGTFTPPASTTTSGHTTRISPYSGLLKPLCCCILATCPTAGGVGSLMAAARRSLAACARIVHSAQMKISDSRAHTRATAFHRSAVTSSTSCSETLHPEHSLHLSSPFPKPGRALLPGKPKDPRWAYKPGHSHTPRATQWKPTPSLSLSLYDVHGLKEHGSCWLHQNVGVSGVVPTFPEYPPHHRYSDPPTMNKQDAGTENSRLYLQ